MHLADAVARRLPRAAEHALAPLAIVGLAALVACSFALFLTEFPARFSDFRAFYCAGSVVRTGGDPYRMHPLHECEHHVAAAVLSPLGDEITIPAPFPGAVLALFALVSLLPFAWAIAACTFVSSAALAGACALLARVTATPPAAVAIVVVFPALVVPLPLGQPTPVMLLAVTACAALLGADRPRWAAAAAFATVLDPHVALAVMVGLFAGVPRARSVIVAGALLTIAGSVFAGGPAREWEYVTRVVPAHALVNVPEFSQFSTANFAFMAGMPAARALVLGNVWYAASLAAGTFVALRLRAVLGVAAIAFVPAAFAVFGGAHTHLQQLALATPAFLLATSAACGPRRVLLVGATFVAAAPWLIFVPFPVLFVAVALLAAAFACAMDVPQIGAALGLGAFWLAAVLCVSVVLSMRRYVPAPFTANGNPLAEVAWGRFVTAHGVPPQLWVYLAKVPTVAAFALLFALLVKLAVAPVRSVAAELSP